MPFSKLMSCLIFIALLVLGLGTWLGFTKILHKIPTTTQVKLFKPWNLNSDELDKKFKVIETLEGDCWTASNENPRPDAWRCRVGNRIMDPCFSSNPTAKVVACSSSPWSHKISLIQLTKPLDNSVANKADFFNTNPWALKLKSKQKCYPIGGATQGFALMRNNYSCGSSPQELQPLLFGPVDCHAGTCQVFYYNPSQSVIVKKSVRELWY